MKKFVISYATQSHFGSQKALHSSLQKFDFNIIDYSPKDLNKDFVLKNLNILSQRRGAGFWVWKPYIILKTFNLMEYGDSLLYSDSAVIAIKNINPLFEIVNNKNVMVFEHGNKELLNKYWTKRDCFILMDADIPEFHNDVQLTATFSLWKKTPENIGFVKEWLKYCEDERVLTNKENTLGKPNYAGFDEHRHDQSILTILSKKYNLERFRDPSQWGNVEVKENSPYEQLFNHHRLRLFG